MSHATQPSAKNPRMNWLPLGLSLVAMLACSSPQQQASRAEPPSPRSFARVDYPRPRGLPSSPEQPQPVLPAQDAYIAPPPGARAGDEIDLMPDAVKNAAVRDQETEQLVRSYFAVAEALYRVASSKRPGSVGDVDSYDAIPLLRLHAQIVGELARLAKRAAMLQMRYLEVAQEDGIGLSGDVEKPGRVGRVRFFFQLCSCIRRDAEDRTSQGMGYLRALQTGATDDDLRNQVPPAEKFLADMQLFGRTVECSRLASRAYRMAP